MISTLAVSGHRSLRDVRLEIGPLNVVTGASGTGQIRPPLKMRNLETTDLTAQLLQPDTLSGNYVDLDSVFEFF